MFHHLYQLLYIQHFYLFRADAENRDHVRKNRTEHGISQVKALPVLSFPEYSRVSDSLSIQDDVRKPLSIVLWNLKELP